MDVRVLGCSGTYPSAHCPCSGYLVTGDHARVWMDAGTGTFAALQGVVDFTSVDAVVISHFHADHCLDLFPYYYALRLHPDAPRGLPVYAPAGTRDHLAGLIAGDSVEVFCSVFDFREVKPGDRVEVGDLTMEFAMTQHPIPTLAVAVANGNHRLVYSADTGPDCDDVLDLAQGADSFICEASWQYGHEGPPLHLNAGEAGELAARAEVGTLLLTHILPSLDHSRSVEEAADTSGLEPVALEAGMVLRTDGSTIERV